MKKKLCMLCLAFVLAFGSVTGAAVPGSQNILSVEAKSKSPSASTLGKAVKKAYGKNYIPNMSLSKAEIKEQFGVSSSYYTSAYVQIPMISAHVDTIAIFKAKNTSAKKAITKKLKSYRSALIKDTMQYPMNRLKIQASRIYTNKNYVCFIMLGKISSSTEQSGNDSTIINAYKKQNNIAVNAIKKALK